MRAMSSPHPPTPPPPPYSVVEPAPQRPPGGAVPTEGGPAPAAPEPAVRPGRHWYWVGGLIFPVTLAFGILLLAPEDDSPAEIFFGIVTPILGFFVGMTALLVVFLVRSSRIAALRRARYPRPHPQQGAYGGHAAYGAYGAGPVHAGPPPPPFRPRIDPGAVRPRARWFWFGGLAVPGGIVVGAVAMWAVMSSGSALPDFAGEVETRGSITFEVAEGETEAWGLWVSPGDASFHYDCELEGSSAHEYPFSFPGVVYESDGWKLVETIDTPTPGEYTLVCDGGAGVSYAVGDTATAEAAHSRRNSGIAALVLTTLAGVVAGTTILVVTAVRRGRSERRLREEASRRAADAPGGGQGPGPGPSAPAGPPPGPAPAVEDARYQGYGVTIVPPDGEHRPRPE